MCLAAQNIPRAISVLTLDNKIILCIVLCNIARSLMASTSRRKVACVRACELNQYVHGCKA